MQGAWALLLSRYSGERDVVFGTVVSGRPADAAGVESMVGLFINTLPVRVRVPTRRGLVAPGCERSSASRREMREYEHSRSWTCRAGARCRAAGRCSRAS